jgi:tRNA threonylcarbamoyladenosine modification (KEOPS) complex  Pcc1 subunit
MKEGGVDAVIRIGLPYRVADALARALKPEADIGLRGVISDVVRYDSELVLNIKAPDISSALATLNGLLRLASSVIDLLKVVESYDAKNL